MPQLLRHLSRVREILVREGPATLLERGIKERGARLLRHLLASDVGFWAVRDIFEDVSNLLVNPVPTIVDGGAYKGRAIDGFLEVFESPSIIAFEPIPDLSAELESRYADRRVRVLQKALGSRNRIVRLHVTENVLSSSLLRPTRLKQEYHGRSVDVRESITVEEVRLEEIVDAEVDVLKLDLQGYELEALRGCGALLDGVQVVMVEVEFAPLYDNQPLFTELAEFLTPRGFQLYNLYDPYTEPDGRLVWADAVFCRESVLERRRRVK